MLSRGTSCVALLSRSIRPNIKENIRLCYGKCNAVFSYDRRVAKEKGSRMQCFSSAEACCGKSVRGDGASKCESSDRFPAPRAFAMEDAARFSLRGTDAQAYRAQRVFRELPRRSLKRSSPHASQSPSRRLLFSGRGSAKRRFVLVALIAVVAACVFGAMALQGSGASGAARSGEVSTPVSEWRAGSIPFLYQTDGAWAGEPYAAGTVAENGCGPTCLTMVYVAVTGRTDYDPALMCTFSERGGFTYEGMTAWALMTEGAATLGLASEELSATESALVAALEAGQPVIASVGPGDFTTTGHFIVIAGMAADGSLVVHDPNSPDRSAQTWDVDRVLSQCLNLWAFSKR